MSQMWGLCSLAHSSWSGCACLCETAVVCLPYLLSSPFFPGHSLTQLCRSHRSPSTTWCPGLSAVLQHSASWMAWLCDRGLSPRPVATWMRFLFSHRWCLSPHHRRYLIRLLAGVNSARGSIVSCSAKCPSAVASFGWSGRYSARPFLWSIASLHARKSLPCALF